MDVELGQLKLCETVIGIRRSGRSVRDVCIMFVHIIVAKLPHTLVGNLIIYHGTARCEF